MLKSRAHVITLMSAVWSRVCIYRRGVSSCPPPPPLLLHAQYLVSLQIRSDLRFVPQLHAPLSLVSRFHVC